MKRLLLFSSLWILLLGIAAAQKKDPDPFAIVEKTWISDYHERVRLVHLTHFDLGFESCTWKTSFSVSSNS